MDWTMVSNAEDAKDRVLTIVYLCVERYCWPARHAGERLRSELPGNELCAQTIGEVRSALSSSNDLGMGTVISDSKARAYLTDMIAAYDAATL